MYANKLPLGFFTIIIYFRDEVKAQCFAKM